MRGASEPRCRQRAVGGLELMKPQEADTDREAGLQMCPERLLYRTHSNLRERIATARQLEFQCLNSSRSILSESLRSSKLRAQIH